MSAALRIETVVNTQDVLGEGPLWCPREQALYWGDLLKPAIHRFHPATGALQSWTPPVKFGSFSLREGGGLILAARTGVVLYDPGAGTLEPLCRPEADRPNNIPNDGKCDRRGRFWFGSMDKLLQQETGALYRIDPDGSHRRMEERVFLSNGLGFSPDDRTFYHTDTHARSIFAYDFDLDAGTIRNRRVLADTHGQPGEPDGMTVDAEGCLWSAQWMAGRLVRYAPDGRVERVVELPVSRPTSCIFGGPALDVLYVTSATFRLPDAERAQQPAAGGILALHVGVKGLPEPRFAG
jgi:sugar lactone lactonase YvrE